MGRFKIRSTGCSLPNPQYYKMKESGFGRPQTSFHTGQAIRQAIIDWGINGSVALPNSSHTTLWFIFYSLSQQRWCHLTLTPTWCSTPCSLGTWLPNTILRLPTVCPILVGPKASKLSFICSSPNVNFQGNFMKTYSGKKKKKRKEKTMIAHINLWKCGEEPCGFWEAEPFLFLGWPCSICSDQCGGILLPWPPGSYPPFFCIYSTLIFLWESIPPRLSEHLFRMLLTPLWVQARRASRIISRTSIWLNKKSMRTTLGASVQTLGFKSSCQPEGRGHLRMAPA